MAEDMEVMEEAEEDMEVAMAVMVVDMVVMGMAKRREKLMLNQKLTLSLKPMLMPTMDMAVMDEDMEVTVAVMVDTDTDVNEEVP